jgi:hypothetical protein
MPSCTTITPFCLSIAQKHLEVGKNMAAVPYATSHKNSLVAADKLHRLM